MKKTILSALTVAIISGCTAVGVPYTSDPSEKIYYAHQLMSVGRQIPAKRLIEEARVIYSDKNDTKGLVEAYFAYGNLYKGLGQWENAQTNYTESKNISLGIPWYHAAARAEFELGIVAIELNNKNITSFCPHADEATRLYDKGIDNGETWRFRLFRNRSFPQLIEENYDVACREKK